MLASPPEDQWLLTPTHCGCIFNKAHKLFKVFLEMFDSLLVLLAWFFILSYEVVNMLCIAPSILFTTFDLRTKLYILLSSLFSLSRFKQYFNWLSISFSPKISKNDLKQAFLLVSKQEKKRKPGSLSPSPPLKMIQK